MPLNNFCENCYRRHIPLDYNCLRTRALRIRVKFCHLQNRQRESATQSAATLPMLHLCEQCKLYLFNIEKQGNNWHAMWPSLIWGHLKHDKFMKTDEFVLFLWQMLPYDWREWWIESAQEFLIIDTRERRYPYRCCTLQMPKPYFFIVTEQYYAAKHIEENLCLGELHKYIQDFCNFAFVKCPWGCHEFIGNCGFVNYENILFHFCNDFLKRKELIRPGFDFRMLDENVIGCRKDYLKFDSNMLPNDIYKFQRCIVMHEDDGAPYVLTCSDHNGGMSCMHNTLSLLFISGFLKQMPPHLQVRKNGIFIIHTTLQLDVFLRAFKIN